MKWFLVLVVAVLAGCSDLDREVHFFSIVYAETAFKDIYRTNIEGCFTDKYKDLKARHNKFHKRAEGEVFVKDVGKGFIMTVVTESELVCEAAKNSMKNSAEFRS